MVKRYSLRISGSGITGDEFVYIDAVPASDYDAAQARIAELERCLDGGVDCANQRITQMARIRELEAELERSVNNARGLWIDAEQQAQRIRELEFRISEIQSIRNAEAKISEIRRQRLCELETALYKIMERTDPPDEDYYDAYHALKGNKREI